MMKYASTYQKTFKASIAAAMAAGMFVTVAPVHTNANEVKLLRFRMLKILRATISTKA